MMTQSTILSTSTSTSIKKLKPAVGWLATEEIYPCKRSDTIRNVTDARGTTLCTSVDDNRQYLPQMPSTELGPLDINIRSFEWACLQRTLLRVIAHTSLLYDPDIMIIGDDDTYINYPLIINKLKYIIHKKMKVEPIALGNIDFQPLISPSGFFHGGAGYIFSSALITKLVSNSIPDPII